MLGTKTPVSRKISQGWIVAFASAVVVFAAANFQYTFGVFVKPLTDTFGWSRTGISATTTVRSVTSMIFAPLVGTWSDRIGPRVFMLIGVILTGLGYVAASRITSIWLLYLSMGVMVGLGMTFAFIPALAAVTRWFGPKSALPVGIVMAGFGLAQIILPPFATLIILQYSWQTSFVVLAVIAWVTGIVAWSFIKNPPGTGTPRGKTADARTNQTAGSVESDFTLSEAMHNSTMWLLIVINVGMFLWFQMTVIHIVPAAIEAGITAEAAAIILTVSGFTNTAGRLALSALTTRVSAKAVLTACFAVQALSVFALGIAQDLHVFYIGAMLYGLTYGGAVAIMPFLAGSYFGTRAFGAIYSILNAVQNIGMATGPLFAGYVYDITGSYFIAFLSAGISLGLIFLLCLWLKPPRYETAEAPAGNG